MSDDDYFRSIPRDTPRSHARPGGSARPVNPRQRPQVNPAGQRRVQPRPPASQPRSNPGTDERFNEANPTRGTGRPQHSNPSPAETGFRGGSTGSGTRVHVRGNAKPLGPATAKRSAGSIHHHAPTTDLGFEETEVAYSAPPRRRTPTRLNPSRWTRLLATCLALLLIVNVLWFGGLLLWANGRLNHIDALSPGGSDIGTTYLIAGSDARDNSTAVHQDGTEGKRSDTIMLLHTAPNGNSYLVSLPRDTLVDIPGKGKYKLNAAYAFGGAPLLVQTVQGLTGLHIDHFIEVGFDGVRDIVNAVGTVNLCIDQDVDDEKSGLKMKKGCHDSDGDQALAFVRARYFDPTADLGRQKRQQQFVAALMKRAITPTNALNPFAQVRLVKASTSALTTDPGTGIMTLGWSALAFKNASANARVLPMPIQNPAVQTRHSGVAVGVDLDEVHAFFKRIGDGSEPAAKAHP